MPHCGVNAPILNQASLIWESKMGLKSAMRSGLLEIKYPCHVGDVESFFVPTPRERGSNFKCSRHASKFYNLLGLGGRLKHLSGFPPEQNQVQNLLHTA